MLPRLCKPEAKSDKASHEYCCELPNTGAFSYSLPWVRNF